MAEGQSAIIAAVAFGLTLPITAIQILWINLVTAVTLGLALAFEPTEPGAMRRPPRKPTERFLTGRLLWRTGFVSLLFVAGALGIFYYAVERGLSIDLARTMVVNTIVAMEIFYLFNVRYIHGTSLTFKGVLGTPAVLIAVAIVVAAQFAFTYLPFLQGRKIEAVSLPGWDLDRRHWRGAADRGGTREAARGGVLRAGQRVRRRVKGPVWPLDRADAIFYKPEPSRGASPPSGLQEGMRLTTFAPRPR